MFPNTQSGVLKYFIHFSHRNTKYSVSSIRLNTQNRFSNGHYFETPFPGFGWQGAVFWKSETLLFRHEIRSTILLEHDQRCWALVWHYKWCFSSYRTREYSLLVSNPKPENMCFETPEQVFHITKACSSVSRNSVNGASKLKPWNRCFDNQKQVLKFIAIYYYL